VPAFCIQRHGDLDDWIVLLVLVFAMIGAVRISALWDLYHYAERWCPCEEPSLGFERLP
jgi:hypothetical protein